MLCVSIDVLGAAEACEFDEDQDLVFSTIGVLAHLVSSDSI